MVEPTEDVAEKPSEKIPYFIKIAGCINCSASKEHKKRTGRDYGFDHELMFKCISSCWNDGFSLIHPYYDPREAVRLAKKDGRKKVISAVKEYCLHIKEKFGEHYDKLGISIDSLINGL